MCSIEIRHHRGEQCPEEQGGHSECDQYLEQAEARLRTRDASQESRCLSED